MLPDQAVLGPPGEPKSPSSASGPSQYSLRFRYQSEANHQMSLGYFG
jgi:hypothetical protein